MPNRDSEIVDAAPTPRLRKRARLQSSAEEIEKGHTSTVRLSQNNLERIDKYIESGFYPSRSRFIMESIRDIFIRLTRDQTLLFPEINSRCNTGAQIKDAMTVAIKKIYLERTGYLEFEEDKPTEIVGLTANRNFLQMAVKHIGSSLSMDGLQAVATFCIFAKLDELDRYSDMVHKAQNDYDLFDELLNSLSEDDYAEILKKIGYD